MRFAGIDCGAKTIKVVIFEDGKILSKSITLTGFDQKENALQAMEEALKSAGLFFDSITNIVATGIGRKEVPFAKEEVTEVTSAAKGAVYLFPTVRTVIDVGAEEGRGIRCDEVGRVIDFVINEKCAAGSGSFIESMARALELSLDDFGRFSLRSKSSVPMNAQCAVFAESEVVSLIHAKIPKEDISRAVHDAMASRISSMVRRVGVVRDVVLIGGVAKNPGFVDSLQRDLKVGLLIPEEPEFVGALGAAILSMREF